MSVLFVALVVLSGFFAFSTVASAQTTTPTVRIVIPERFRVLTNQLFDLRIEAENLSSVRARVQVNVTNENGQTEQINFAGPFDVVNNVNNNPNDIDRATTYRKMSFATPGIKTIQAIVTDGRRIFGFSTQISVQDFNLNGQKSIVLLIGDAMGTAYRDAGRIVSQSTDNRFREGFFDELQEMDKMPVTGMSMTYSLEQITPDSANTGTAWATGNKTANNYVNVFPDNTDVRYSSSNIQATKQFALDNPRVETLWQYMKRRHGYKTGIVTTSDVTDATPAAEGGHSAFRALGFDIARQYVEGSITAGNQFDVIMGGGLERFNARTATNSGDTRNLVIELQNAGYTYVANRAELNALSATAPPSKVLGLFRTGNMNVAYDKLLLTRPSDEPAPNFGGFTNQPFLDEMTSKAIATLRQGGSPFILMVEGSSIDKQSHPNYAAGQIWDTIEFDKSVGVSRGLLNSSEQTRANTLVVVTADHDQSMSIIGAVDTSVSTNVQNVIATLPYPNGNRGSAQGQIGVENATGEAEAFPDYQDANGDRYPENTNRFRIKLGYRTGNHTGSSVPVTAEGAGALLFYGYYDQTDLFFKMAKSLSTNTTALDQAVTLKANSDVPVFNPAQQQLVDQKATKGGVIMLRREPLTTPRIISTDEDRFGHEAEEKRQEELNNEGPKN
ncbi:MAG: alkaline phosphatase [Pyrinomonadaceae bacterium]|nr:alkaline phosphatase [Pyrinomonadaceae bacterium]